MTIELDQYLGSHRLLLVFAMFETDPRVIQQRRLIEARRADFDQRDLVLRVVDQRGASLRQRFGVGPEDFVVMLIGKDGGEKTRSETPMTMTQLFPLIDAMPE